MMTTTFQAGDSVKVNESMDLLPSLRKYAGRIGRVFHAEQVMSPYSGAISQSIGVRFSDEERPVSENSSWFLRA